MKRAISKCSLKLIICILSVFILGGWSNSNNDKENKLMKEKDKLLHGEESKVELKKDENEIT